MVESILAGESIATLDRSEELFRRIIEAAPEAIGIICDGVFVFTNPALARILGYARIEEVLGRAPSSFIEPSEIPVYHHRVAAICEGRALASQTYRVLRPDRTITLIETESIPVGFEGKRAILTFARDVTERTRLHEQLLHANRMAAVGTLAAGVAHEINNPLAYVSLVLDLLHRDIPRVPDEPQRTFDLLAAVDEARGGVQRVSAIVRDLRTFSRTDGGSDGLVDLRHAVESAVKMVDHDLRHRARLVVDLAALPPFGVREARLAQVFLNLLVNASQALADARRGDHEVRVVASAETAWVHVDVSDTGVGIPASVLPHVFEPFFTTKPVGVGTGLGLSICRNIVSSLGGRLEVQSVEGAGTTFRVSLPRTAARVADGGPARTAVPLRRRRVLVVDDEPALAAMVQRELQTDHDVVVASSGTAALARLDEEDFDVVVCDVMMPDMSGVDLHDELRKRRPGHERRVVLMTGGVFTPRTQELIERVGSPTLSKPFTGDDLRAAIRHVLTTSDGA